MPIDPMALSVCASGWASFCINYDEVEVVNALGAFTGVHKIGLFYWALINLPAHHIEAALRGRADGAKDLGKGSLLCSCVLGMAFKELLGN